MQLNSHAGKTSVVVVRHSFSHGHVILTETVTRIPGKPLPPQHTSRAETTYKQHGWQSGHLFLADDGEACPTTISLTILRRFIGCTGTL